MTTQDKNEITELKTLIKDIADCRITSEQTGNYAGWNVTGLSKLHHRISEVIHGLNAGNIGQSKCGGCGADLGDEPNGLCPGCSAYQDHICAL